MRALIFRLAPIAILGPVSLLLLLVATPGRAAPPTSPPAAEVAASAGAPFDIVFRVDPPLDPKGRPWFVRCGRMAPYPGGTAIYPDDLCQIKRERQGLFDAPQQGPGLFWVTVETQESVGLYARTNLEMRNLADARPTLRLTPLELEGRVTRDGRPVATPLSLWMGDGLDDDLVLTPDAEGRFRGQLLGDGGRCWVWLEGIPVPFEAEVRSDRPGHARLDLEIPSTRLFGRVLDSAGRPIPGAPIAVSRPGLSPLPRYVNNDLERWQPMRTEVQPAGGVQADGDGYFEILGAPPGEVTLQVYQVDSDEEEKPVGEAVTYDLGLGSPVGPVTLRARPR